MKPPLKPWLKRDYGLATLAERQPAPLEGEREERQKLGARMRERQLRGKNAVASAAVPPAKPEEFCPRLAAVMAAATGNFVALRGKEATEVLPGMRSCSIERAGDDDLPPFTDRKSTRLN